MTVRFEVANTVLIANIMIDNIVDAVIMPVAPHAAVIHGKYYHTGVSTHR